MKKTLIGLAIIAISLTSCEEFECDTSTAEGAADCACYYHDQQSLDVRKDDKSLADDVKAGLEKWKEEVDKHIENGDYTQVELEKLLDEKGCMPE